MKEPLYTYKRGVGWLVEIGRAVKASEYFSKFQHDDVHKCMLCGHVMGRHYDNFDSVRGITCPNGPEGKFDVE